METFSLIRLVVGYPLATVAGLIWLLGFGAVWWMSPSGGRNGSAGWAALAGAGIMVYGLAGLLGLWLSDQIGFGRVTSAVVTIGQAFLVGAAVAGSFWLLRRAWVERWRNTR